MAFEPMFVRPVGIAGIGSAASGSETTWLPVTGWGLNVGLPLLETPPTTWMPAAFTEAAPLIVMALDDFESTITSPVTLMLALPDRLIAPPAVGSRT